MSGALSGVRVLEVASYVTGPLASMMLADLGAEVVKLEELPNGDPFRRWESGGRSPVFWSLNRNKKSVAVDLKEPSGHRLLDGLVRWADVLIENHRPGVAERRGFGYEAVRRVNPGVVYCSVTGYGPTGPYRDRPGYDTVGQALSGLLSLVTDLDGAQPMGISLSDHLTGLFAACATLGALVHKERTGEGQHVETSLLEASLAFAGEAAANFLANGEVATRRSRATAAGVFTVYGSDGLPFVVHLSSPPKFWQGLLAATDRQELLDDPRFAGRPERRVHYDELRAELQKTFDQAPRDHWLARLAEHDVPSAPLNTMAETLSDAQVAALDMTTTVSHPRLGTVALVRPGMRMGVTPPSIVAPPPDLGEHTELVSRWLDDEERAPRPAGDEPLVSGEGGPGR